LVIRAGGAARVLAAYVHPAIILAAPTTIHTLFHADTALLICRIANESPDSPVLRVSSI